MTGKRVEHRAMPFHVGGQHADAETGGSVAAALEWSWVSSGVEGRSTRHCVRRGGIRIGGDVHGVEQADAAGAGRGYGRAGIRKRRRRQGGTPERRGRRGLRRDGEDGF
jgi:hypothetical protein